MKRIAIVQSKGGVGKSSLACLLTMALDNSGVPVAVLDLDPQGTTQRWLSDHLATLPNVCLLPSPDATPSMPAAVCLIDTEGRSNFEHTLPGIPECDLYLIPATPSIEDIRIAAKTIELLHKHRPGANLRLIWNRIREGQDDSNPKLLKQYAEGMGIIALRNFVHESKPYRDAQYPAPRGGWSRVTRSRFYQELRGVALEVLSCFT